MRVLIADDHDLVRVAIAAFLKREGVIEVQTGTYLGEDDIIRYEDIYARA